MAKGLPAAFVTFVIGSIAAGIAYRQWKVAQAKLKLDLFNRRYEIFEMVWRELSQAVLSNRLEADNTNFTNLLPQAEFLFGREIHTYMSDVSSKINRLRYIKSGYDSPNISQSEKNKMRKEEEELHEWFVKEAQDDCRMKFGKYMSFDNWH